MSTPPSVDGGEKTCDLLQKRERTALPFDPRTQSQLLTVDEAAQYLRLSKSTLARWRMGFQGRYGPPYVKHASRVFYRLTDLDAFIKAGLTTHTSASAVRAAMT